MPLQELEQNRVGRRTLLSSAGGCWEGLTEVALGHSHA